MAILSFLRLEDFVEEAKTDYSHEPLRVEGVSRIVPNKPPGGDLIEWYVLVTTKIDDDIVMYSIRVGRCLAIFAKNESYHVLNVRKAEHLLKAHLTREGFEVRPGLWEPSSIMENLSDGRAGLWHFKEKMMVANVDEENG